MQQGAHEVAYDKAADNYLKESEPTEGRKHGKNWLIFVAPFGYGLHNEVEHRKYNT
jgi:hypothetical protein